MITLTSEITVSQVEQAGNDRTLIVAMQGSTKGQKARQVATDMSEEGVYGRLKTMMRLGHSSVFEHGWLMVEVHQPAFSWWEWVRHRFQSLDVPGLSFNLESGRYRELEPVFWVPRRERPMVPVGGYKPTRPQFKPMADDDLYGNVIESMRNAYTRAWESYKLLTWDRDRRKEYENDFPIAPEVARSKLRPLPYFTASYESFHCVPSRVAWIMPKASFTEGFP